MGKGVWKMLFLIGFVTLVWFQARTTNIREAYNFTPHQIDQQIKRMNMYPPSLARVGYLMEVKKEGKLLGGLANNFFTVVDLKEYFPERLPYVTAPFFLVGLYGFIEQRKRWRLVFTGFIAAIVILTVLGSHAKYGPVLIMAFLILFVILGLVRILKIKWG